MTEMNTKQKLFSIIKDVVANDEKLREKYQIGDKFRFIRERLRSLYKEVEDELQAEVLRAHSKDTLAENQQLVYVYLYNAQGILLSTWQKLLNPSAYYDHSVNRPIYGDSKEIEALISTKSNPQQHAYLIFAVDKQDVQLSGSKDMLGNHLLKVKEGILKFSDLKGFMHHHHQYQVLSNGEIKKINEQDQ